MCKKIIKVNKTLLLQIKLQFCQIMQNMWNTEQKVMNI